MGRRRRKQERAERETPRTRLEDQGELLAADVVKVPADEPEEEVREIEETVFMWSNARTRELVLFELVDEVGQPAVAAAPTEEPAVEPVAPPPAVTAAAVDGPADAPEPNDSEPSEPRSFSFDESENQEQALERLEAARALSPDSVGVLVGLGWTLGLLGRYEEAERELRRAQRLAPDDIAVRAGLGLLSYRRGLYPQAEAELRWVCEQDPQHGPAHFYRGEALNRLGRVDQALEMLERAARLQPTNYRAFYTMGILFDRKNLREEAAAMYRKARELQSGAPRERISSGWERR
jgi:tetratricopeptide (TPR) repeat protein